MAEDHSALAEIQKHRDAIGELREIAAVLGKKIV